MEKDPEHRITIVYCHPCGYLPRAIEMANYLLSTYGYRLNKRLSVSLQPSDGGVYEVWLGDRLLFSRYEAGRFPTTDEIRGLVDRELGL